MAISMGLLRFARNDMIIREQTFITYQVRLSNYTHGLRGKLPVSSVIARHRTPKQITLWI
jgi:hypothetical protein